MTWPRLARVLHWNRLWTDGQVRSDQQHAERYLASLQRQRDYLCYTQLTQQDIPNYFAYAANFVLADNAFSSISSASFPNHLYTVAATSGGVISNPLNANSIWGCDAPSNVTVTVLDDQGYASSQFPCFDFPLFPTVFRILGLAGRITRLDMASRATSGPRWMPSTHSQHTVVGPACRTYRPVRDRCPGRQPARSKLACHR